MAKAISKAVSPDLLSPQWKALSKPDDHPTAGHCYICAEAAYHLLGGKKAGYSARVANLGKDEHGRTMTHWWIEGPKGRVDPTAAQFSKDELKEAYAKGKPIGFLTTEPSKRAQVLMKRVSK